MQRHRSRRTTSRIIAAALLVGSAGVGLAKPVVVLGDSIGVGISMASGAQRLATESVAIRSAGILEQIRRAPRGAVAVISLGTNDAVGNIKGVEGGIDRVVEAVDGAGLQAVWVGPPCVNKSWNATATRLDGILKARLGRGDVKYVSVADPSICERGLRAGDGVHFTMKGYALLWDRAREAIGGPVDLKPVAVASIDRPRKRASARKLRHARHGGASQGAHQEARRGEAGAQTAALPAPAR